MDWSRSFLVKDVISMLNGISRGKTEYVNSFRPDLLDAVTQTMLDCPERPQGHEFVVKAPHHEYENICLTSGGADSTIAWYRAGKPQGVYVNIDQPYALKETKALQELEIPYVHVDMRGTHLADNRWHHIIPGRNFLFLCVAAEMLKDNGTIWFAVVDGEGVDSGRGDKSLYFIELFLDWYTSCTGRPIRVKTMVERTKAGWLRWFSENQHDVNIIRYKTVTCFNGVEGQCGECQACLRKYLSFVSIGMDTAKDYVVHPMIGADIYVKKYEIVLASAQIHQNFSHYSRRRCEEDLLAISNAKRMISL